MNSNTIRRIKALAQNGYNARWDQGQGRIMNINMNLRMIKMNHNANDVNRIYNREYMAIAHNNRRKQRRKNLKVRNAAHRFKVGPRIKAAIKTNLIKNLAPNMQNEIMKLVRKRN
jgi:hypothetical protein